MNMCVPGVSLEGAGWHGCIPVRVRIMARWERSHSSFVGFGRLAAEP